MMKDTAEEAVFSLEDADESLTKTSEKVEDVGKPPVKNKEDNTAPATDSGASYVAILAAFLVLILIIVLSVVLTRDDDGDYVPITTNFVTG